MTGNNNTASGYYALVNNTTGTNNTANGINTLALNQTGGSNTATGATALYHNNGSYNTANGGQALYTNTTGIDNTASGYAALYRNTSGFNNTAYGGSALYDNTTGSNNIAVGTYAGVNLTTGGNNIDIGNYGVAGDSDKIRIGTQGTQTATFIAGIRGATVAGGVGVIVGPNGKLGTVTSSARFKDEIKPMNKASEAILALKPVTFHYKHELDPDGIPQFGLVAEEVAKVNPDLVARDEEGKAYTVRYEAVNAMLLNEFLKEHRKVEEQDRKIAEQNNQAQDQKAAITQLQSTVAKQDAAIAQERNEIEMLTSTLREQALQIQKVSARLATGETSLHVAVNGQLKPIK
jgi:Chaperone of endosialidase